MGFPGFAPELPLEDCFQYLSYLSSFQHSAPLKECAWQCLASNFFQLLYGMSHGWLRATSSFSVLSFLSFTTLLFFSHKKHVDSLQHNL